jgi:hypothetical protein
MMLTYVSIIFMFTAVELQAAPGSQATFFAHPFQQITTTVRLVGAMGALVPANTPDFYVTFFTPSPVAPASVTVKCSTGASIMGNPPIVTCNVGFGLTLGVGAVFANGQTGSPVPTVQLMGTTTAITLYVGSAFFFFF